MAPYSLPNLPVANVLTELIDALAENQQAVLEAPPGAGKTTLVPLALLPQRYLDGQKIIMLEPRRMAARAAAERMAELVGERVGETIGYRVRQEVRTSAKTRIEVVTGGILTRWLQEDPTLEGIGLVIFDEFHERHLDSDLGLALCLQGRDLFRADGLPLRLLVMSATLDGAAVADLLGDAPRIRSHGRQFPVKVIYGREQSLAQPIDAAVVQTVRRVLAEETGNILVFLPGQREIEQVRKQLQSAMPNHVDLMPLYGALSLEEQRRALAPPGIGSDGQPRRKVVLATDVAESSLTIEGVRVVIDAGRSREPAFDPVTGMTRLTTGRVSQASSDQRCGRAGRLEPGRCYRLWSAEQQYQLRAQSTPEILQADLSALALQLLRWGIDEPAELRWLDPPPAAAFAQSLQQLETFGAVTRSPAGIWQLTAHGEHMSRIPAHPRLGHLLICAKQADQLSLGAGLAAILSEPVYQGNTTDITYPLSILMGSAPCPKRHSGWLQRVRRLAGAFENLLKDAAIPEQQQVTTEDAPGYLLSCGFPDRIAKRRPGQHLVYQLANGRSATLAEGDPLANNDWLACAEVGGVAGRREDRIFSAASLNPQLFETQLAALTRNTEVLEWDRKAGRFLAEGQVQVGSLTLSKARINAPSPAKRIPALLAFIRKEGLDLLPWTEELRQWLARVRLLYNLNQPDNPWPDLSDEALVEHLEEWLAPYLTEVRTLADFQRLNLKQILEAQLPWPLLQQLDQLAPPHFVVPSGSRITLDYRQSPPVLAVKLQEMFGCEDTPRVANGQVPVMVHLLSPARRPLQITQDLAGFWRSGYQDVKKEMKGRYPKHPWPDDPLQALPSRHTKARAKT